MFRVGGKRSQEVRNGDRTGELKREEEKKRKHGISEERWIERELGARKR